MQSFRAASAAANLLIVVTFGVLSQISSNSAATRCPSGQILRVSLGICVAKAENLAIMTKHRSRKGETADAEEDAPRVPAQRPVRADGANSPQAEEAPIEVAEHAAPESAGQSAPRPSPQPQSSLLSPFGALFVGAFHSTVSTGMSVFR